MKPGSDHVVIVDPVEARAGGALCGTCALEGDARDSGRCSRAQNVLALHGQETTTSEVQRDVWTALLIGTSAVGHAGNIAKHPHQMFRGDPATYSHLQPPCRRDQIEHFVVSHLELARESVHSSRGRDDRQSLQLRLRLEAPHMLCEKLAMALVEAMRRTLEPNVLEEGGGGSTNENLDGIEIVLNLLPFPGMPACCLDRVDVGLLELQADEESSRVVHLRVGSNEETELRVDADEERCVEAVRVLPDLVQLAVFRPVLDLKRVLVDWPVLRWRERRQEGVSQDPNALAKRRLECDPERSFVRRCVAKDRATLSAQCGEHELEQRSSIARIDAIPLVVHASMLASRKQNLKETGWLGGGGQASSPG